MSSLSAKDRVSLCSFTFSDGRRCRTPRIGKHPRFCFYHAQKEARSRAAEKLGKDLAYFFSGDYLSACDLSTALARLIPAVVRGDVKPKTAHTVAYLVQTLMQAIHISQHEYINAFGTDGWRKSVRNSVNGNYDYRFPFTPSEAEGPDPEPDPEPEQSAPSASRMVFRDEPPQPQPAPVAHPACPERERRVRGEAFRSTGATSPAPPQTQAQPPASAPPSNPPQLAAPPIPAPVPQPTAVAHPFRGEASSSASQPAETPVNGHSERSGKRPTSGASPESDREEPAFSSHSPIPSQAPPTPAPASSARSVAPAAQSDNPRRTGPSALRPAPNRDARAHHFDHSCRLLIDGKPF
jgi:hypothetical protein